MQSTEWANETRSPLKCTLQSSLAPNVVTAQNILLKSEVQSSLPVYFIHVEGNASRFYCGKTHHTQRQRRTSVTAVWPVLSPGAPSFMECSVVTVLKCVIILKQGDPHFHFALGPTKCAACSRSEEFCCPGHRGCVAYVNG